LNEKTEEGKRTCYQIVDNMGKLVEDPAEVLPVLPRLEPMVKTATEKISDPEAHGMAECAYTTLQKAAGKGAEEVKTVQAAAVVSILKEASALRQTMSSLRTWQAWLHQQQLAQVRCRSGREVVGYPPCDSVIDAVRAKLQDSLAPEEELEDEDGDGVDLYKGSSPWLRYLDPPQRSQDAVEAEPFLRFAWSQPVANATKVGPVIPKT